jgi:phosphate starvation-inducible membrane PsiE
MGNILSQIDFKDGDFINMPPNSPKDASKIEALVEKWTVPIGNLFVSLFHRIALFGIGAATVWSAAVAFLGMLQKGSASIEDLLLLFIYLEIGAMVGIYFKTNHMPVRFLIYVAITAVTRLIIDLVNTKHEADMAILLMGLTILILALANAIVRYASHKFPSRSGDNE